MLANFGQLAQFSWRATRKVASVATGVTLIVAGVALLGWVGYNLFSEQMPAAEGREPFGATHFSIWLIGAGVVFVRD